MKRRDFLKVTAAVAGAAAMPAKLQAASPAITPPVVDKLSVTVLIDLIHNTFLRPLTFNGVTVQPAPAPADFTRILHTQWGLSLYLASLKGDESRNLVLDFGYTPEALLNNFELLR